MAQSEILFIILRIFIVFLIRQGNHASSGMYHSCLNGRYEKARYFQTESCYFMVKDATDKANEKMPNGKYKFNVTLARAICDDHASEFPIITSPEENKFLGNFSIDQHAVAIALQVGKYEPRKWSDGSHISYWPEKLVQHAYLDEDEYYGIQMPTTKLKEWHLLPIGLEVAYKTAVVCESPYEYSMIPISNCLPPKKYEFNDTLVYNRMNGNGGARYRCIFIIPGANEKVMKAGSSEGKFKFNLDYARAVCHSRGGILATVKTQCEHDAVKKFHQNNFPDLDKVVLGIEDTKWGLLADDGFPVKFIPENFNPQNKTMKIFLMTNENYTWKETDRNEEIDGMASIICQQAHTHVLLEMPALTDFDSDWPIKYYPRRWGEGAEDTATRNHGPIATMIGVSIVLIFGY